ncbi:MAG: hypothetical protein E7316_07545 [Clostridiales bacterium]|nr:hypothetical protein [Clostridiales bacterium]
MTGIDVMSLGFVPHISYNGPEESEDRRGENRRSRGEHMNGNRNHETDVQNTDVAPAQAQETTQATGSSFTLEFHFKNRRETDLDEINRTLARHALSGLKLEDHSGYLTTETTTKPDEEDKIIRYWYGLDDLILGCWPATAQDSFIYQISTMTMEKTEKDCAARWREANPGRAMRTMLQMEYEDRYAVIVLHHEKIECADAADCEQVEAENRNEQELRYAETEAYMKTFIGRMHAASGYEEMHQLLAEGVFEEELTKIDTITYSCGDYIIEDVLSLPVKEKITVLKRLNEKHLRIFPEYIDSQVFGDFCILIIRIDGTNGEAMIPFRQGYQLLSEEARMEAYKDIERLVRAKLFVRSILSARYNPLLITPVTHRLVLGNWMFVEIIKAEEVEDILDDVYRLIFGKERQAETPCASESAPDQPVDTGVREHEHAKDPKPGQLPKGLPWWEKWGNS